MITFNDDKDRYYLRLALLTATRSTCVRAARGCLLVNANGKVLATGYNGVPRKLAHCTDTPCAGAGYPSGEGLDLCMAVHAEQNALIQCTDPESIYTCYTTASPCMHCVKMLLNTPCYRLVFSEEYPHHQSRRLWNQTANKIWIHLPTTLESL